MLKSYFRKVSLVAVLVIGLLVTQQLCAVSSNTAYADKSEDNVRIEIKSIRLPKYFY